jgi:alpha-aminoadipate carrier protein LysW
MGGKHVTVCPECEGHLDLDVGEIEEGEVVSCLECGTDFEVVTVTPLELKQIEDEEDEEDDDLDEESENGDYS